MFTYSYTVFDFYIPSLLSVNSLQINITILVSELNI